MKVLTVVTMTVDIGLGAFLITYGFFYPDLASFIAGLLFSASAGVKLFLVRELTDSEHAED